ncbi:MAG: hypothetical protein ACQERL_05690 [Bacillota bacterium]|jgi:hypothetical protein
MQIKNLSHTAFSLALIFISFMLFRGSTNIVNAVVVPTVFYLTYIKFSWKEYLTLILMTLIFSILFFFQQIFFIFLYALLGIVLVKLFHGDYKNYFKIIILTKIFALGFFVTLNLTDFILGTALQPMFFSMMGDKLLYLILFYIVNSLLVSLALNFIVPQIEAKI